MKKIIKKLSEILMEFNFRLHTAKTEVGEDIVLMSIKKDKLDNIIYHVDSDKEMNVYKLKRLLLDILNISKNYPNSGFTLKMLQHFNKKDFFKKSKAWYKNEVDLLIAILLDIALNNPRCFSVICVGVFNLLPKTKQKESAVLADVIFKKLNSMNNIGYNEIWLQRCLYKVDTTKQYNDNICKVVGGEAVPSIFGNHFITDSDLLSLLNKNNFIDREKLEAMPIIPDASEVNIFGSYY